MIWKGRPLEFGVQHRDESSYSLTFATFWTLERSLLPQRRSRDLSYPQCLPEVPRKMTLLAQVGRTFEEWISYLISTSKVGHHPSVPMHQTAKQPIENGAGSCISQAHH